MKKVNLLRSVLFCPGDRDKVIQKALNTKSDVVIIDLEDAVGQPNKINARNNVSQFLKTYQGLKQIVIRINCPHTTEWGKDDLLALTRYNNISAILLPKVENKDHIESVSHLVYNDIGIYKKLWAMIETPRGVLNAMNISEHQNIDCLVFGSNDLTKDIKAKHTLSREPLLYAMSHCILAARASNKNVLDGVYSNYQDIEGFKTTCIQGKNLGFDGKTLIHPSQIDITNEIFTPSKEDIEFAQKVVIAWNNQTNGFGIVTVDGRMIESLHYQEAIEVLLYAHATGYKLDDNLVLSYLTR